MSEHVASKKAYIAVWVALLCLTAVTATVSYLELGPFNVVVALIIATCKATLVALIFMGVKYISQRMTWVVIIAAFFWLFILLALSMTDYISRSWR
jgi:cytochrome c oxidase subunit IV